MKKSAPMETSEKKSASSVQERRISLVLTTVLILIAVVIVVLQSRFDPAQWRQQRISDTGGLPRIEATNTAPDADVDAVPGLQPLSPTEHYQADNLSDKIDGKAELYLRAGFRSLETRRFSMDGASGRWLERYVYDMGSHRSAFSVFSTQRRSNIAPYARAVYGYVAANGLFLVHGHFYVEIIAAEVSEAMVAKMKALGEAFVQDRNIEFSPLTETTLFPPGDRRPHSLILTAANAFGLQELDWVYSANYRKDQAEASAFLTKRASVQEARRLADAFSAYWADYGGEILTPSEKLPQARIVSILDNFEVVLTRGVYLIGIHEANQLAYAIDLAGQLDVRVKEALK